MRRCLAVAASVLAGVVLAACSGTPDPPPPSLGIVEHRAVPASLMSLPLTDQHGHHVTLSSWRGRTVVLVPFLTLCTDICPMDTGNLVQVQRVLDRAGVARQVQLVELSVDPRRDTPARLAAYARLTGANWQLVTESPAVLSQFERSFGWYVQRVHDGEHSIDWWTGKALTYDVNHSDGFEVIGPGGTLRFATGAAPDFHGRLNPTLHHFLSPEGIAHLHRPPQPGWTPAQLLGTIAWAIHRSLPPPA
jgi:protein SCO1/2